MLAATRHAHALDASYAQRSPVPRRDVRRRCGLRAAVARHRRRGVGQDQHARASRRASSPARGGPAAHPAADVHAPRRGRPRAACRAHRACVAGAARRRPAAVAALGRHVPQRRRAAAARVCRARRIVAQFHDPRPRRLAGPDEPRAPRAGRRRRDGEPLPGCCDVRRDLFAHRQCRVDARGDAGVGLSVVRALGRAAARAVRRLRCRQAVAAGARSRRPPALLGGNDGNCTAGRRDRRALRLRAGRRIPGHEQGPGDRSCGC